ncbi:MAG: pseudaminic acid synthase [Patescibacteria group bacterium]|nr:pseudaminic acid synthase [Patescibacteria group bacterium]
MAKEFKIKNKTVGEGHPALIIAELSANHNGDFEKAKTLVIAACEAGADIVKIQTYTPNTMTLDSNKDPFQVKVNDAWKNRTLHQLYQIAQTPWEWHAELEKTAWQYEVPLIGTPYDATSIDFLEKMNCPCVKIASFEATDVLFLQKAAQTRKPVIISRGMTTFEELSQAITVLKENNAKDIAILHCVSAYPTKPEDLNLLNILEIKKHFPEHIVGLSDHSLLTSSGPAAVALGAKVIERHFIMNRTDGGPDAAFSLEPQEFAKMVKEIREVEKALGKPDLSPTESEKENIVFRRSLWVIKDVKKGEVFSKENVASFRPANGLEVKYFSRIIGKKAAKDIEKATPLNWDLIDA